MDDEKDLGEAEIPVMEATATSEIEGVILPEIEGGDGIYRPFVIGDSQTELELTIDDAVRLLAFLAEGLEFLEGRKNGLM
jgi:hypothetical protein